MLGVRGTIYEPFLPPFILRFWPMAKMECLKIYQVIFSWKSFTITTSIITFIGDIG